MVGYQLSGEISVFATALCHVNINQLRQMEERLDFLHKRKKLTCWELYMCSRDQMCQRSLCKSMDSDSRNRKGLGIQHRS